MTLAEERNSLVFFSFNSRDYPQSLFCLISSYGLILSADLGCIGIDSPRNALPLSNINPCIGASLARKFSL